ncbi:hypothetical protein H4R20_005264 [Coemansia guatemalensis]|uniref:protein-histidine N-methyltransferase n=1 Tax=Coemansia guatemalensis TaxID=2761395 RepID=A0A9W8HQ52_9FUNG|nr:hypothetical protein H4R20_005264 [Coemansia guatemalensis]
MSFRFNFSDGDENQFSTEAPDNKHMDDASEPCEDGKTGAHNAICEFIPLAIPPVSSIMVDAIYYNSGRLWKRQMDDVQFQLAQQDSMDGSNNISSSAVEQVIASGSSMTDVIRGVYEGGLKTWECSLDLLGYLAEHGASFESSAKDLHVLELGCGTGLPSLHILKNMPNARVCMQDYNRDVIELITIPNVLANTALSPDSETLGDSMHSSSNTEACEIDIDYRRTKVLFGSNIDETIGRRELPELTGSETEEANALLLRSTDIAQRCEFISGDWANIEATMRSQGREHTFNLILTSETIYDTASYESLHGLLACLLARPSCSSSTDQRSEPAVLVAAKSIYFGLSGSVLTFVQYVQRCDIFNIESVWQSRSSMGREILRMTWKDK